MSDPVVNLTNGIPTTGNGQITTLGMVMDPTNGPAAIKAGSTPPAAADKALVVSISPNSVNANGLAAAANSAPVVLAPQTLSVPVTPANSTAQYTSGNVLGGILTFSSVLPSIGFNGILQSITGKFKDTTSSASLTVTVFKQSPSNGTYTDKSAPSYNSSDMQFMLGSYSLSPTTPFGTGSSMAIYNLDGIGKAIVASSASLFAVVTVGSCITPNSTNTFTLELSVLPG